MINLSKLLKLAERFERKAQQYTTYVSPDNEEDPPLSENDIDIKDENLFKQFSQFMESYHEVMDLLSIDPDQLMPNTFQDAAEIINTLKTRYQRLITNPYLDNENEYSEEFSPGEFTKFIQQKIDETEDRFASLTDGEVTVDEVAAQQLAEQFNQSTPDQPAGGVPGIHIMENQGMRMTGDRVKQLIDIKKTYFQKLMLAKKLDTSHPERQRYQQYIDRRKKWFKAMKLDPVKREKWLNNHRKNSNQWKKNLVIRRNYLEEAIKNTNNPAKKSEFTKELTKIKSSLNIITQNNQKDLKNKIEKGGLVGAITKFQFKISQQKDLVAKRIKYQAAKSPLFTSIKREVGKAKVNFDANPTPENKKILEDALKTEVELLTRYLNEHDEVVKTRKDMEYFLSLRDSLKEKADANNVKTVLEAGHKLGLTYKKEYPIAINALIDLLTEVEKNL